MRKTILITGATDGIGLATAKLLAAKGHDLLIHGRNPAKIATTRAALEALNGDGSVVGYCADFVSMSDVRSLATSIAEKYNQLDVIINNAGIFKTKNNRTEGGHDVRFLVNTIAPYLLTKLLLPLVPRTGRIINLSSAAQASVDLRALKGAAQLSDSAAYAQSKLAITMWSFDLAKSVGRNGPVIVAVNPASLLGSKMVKEAYGMEGKDIGIGANILVRAALSDDFSEASGKYFDNDSSQFAQPHADALNLQKNTVLVKTIEDTLFSLLR